MGIGLIIYSLLRKSVVAEYFISVSCTVLHFPFKNGRITSYIASNLIFSSLFVSGKHELNDDSTDLIGHVLALYTNNRYLSEVPVDILLKE